MTRKNWLIKILAQNAANLPLKKKYSEIYLSHVLNFKKYVVHRRI